MREPVLLLVLLPLLLLPGCDSIREKLAGALAGAAGDGAAPAEAPAGWEKPEFDDAAWQKIVHEFEKKGLRVLSTSVSVEITP